MRRRVNNGRRLTIRTPTFCRQVLKNLLHQVLLAQMVIIVLKMPAVQLMSSPIRCGCTRSRPGQQENCDWVTASNYYCPAGTTSRKIVDRSAGYCGARPINYDTFRYTAQELCPRLNITLDSTSAVVSNSKNLTTNTDT